MKPPSIPPPDQMAPRLTCRPLPAYRFVPGRHPHPTRHADGHGGVELVHVERPVADWRRCEAYLYGIDLFNARYFWEAHEAWELPWRAAPDPSKERAMMQALIVLAAALLKVHLAQPEPAERLAARGAGRLDELASHGELMGFVPAELAATARACIVAHAAGPLERAAFQLVPRMRAPAPAQNA